MARASLRQPDRDARAPSAQVVALAKRVRLFIALWRATRDDTHHLWFGDCETSCL